MGRGPSAGERGSGPAARLGVGGGALAEAGGILGGGETERRGCSGGGGGGAESELARCKVGIGDWFGRESSNAECEGLLLVRVAVWIGDSGVVKLSSATEASPFELAAAMALHRLPVMTYASFGFLALAFGLRSELLRVQRIECGRIAAPRWYNHRRARL